MSIAGDPLPNYRCDEPAPLGRTRAAGLLDLLVAAVVAMIALPQPVVRQAIMGGRVTPVGVVIFVAALLFAVMGVYWLYLTFALVSWGRSGAMYLLGLGVDAPTKPTFPEAALFALGWVMASVPALLGAGALVDSQAGLPARMSGLQTYRVSAHEEGDA